jgi:hypothetical protein
LKAPDDDAFEIIALSFDRFSSGKQDVQFICLEFQRFCQSSRKLLWSFACSDQFLSGLERVLEGACCELGNRLHGFDLPCIDPKDQRRIKKKRDASRHPVLKDFSRLPIRGVSR